MSTITRYALIITNSWYNDSSFNHLRTPKADGEDIRNILINPEIAAFQSENVTLLHDQPSTVVRRAITDFFRNKKRDDLLFFYFSGHGVLDANSRLYFAVVDTERMYLTDSAIEAVRVDSKMKACRSQRKIVVLDCCHSGGYVDGGKRISGLIPTRAIFDPKGYGHYILTATDKLQQAWEGHKINPKYKHSLFTHHFIEGLVTGAAGQSTDEYITMDALKAYINQRVLEEEDVERRQTPMSWSDKVSGELIIARNISYQSRYQEIYRLRAGTIWEFMEKLPDFKIQAVCLDIGIPLTGEIGALLERVAVKNLWNELLDALWDYHRIPFETTWGIRENVIFVGRSEPFTLAKIQIPESSEISSNFTILPEPIRNVSGSSVNNKLTIHPSSVQRRGFGPINVFTSVQFKWLFKVIVAILSLGFIFACFFFAFRSLELPAMATLLRSAEPTPTFWFGNTMTPDPIQQLSLTTTQIALNSIQSGGGITPSFTPLPETADKDRDGLTDNQEASVNTDPNNSDTDLDGLLDGDEVLLYGTHPTVGDSDGDFLLDGDEVLRYFTNPNNIDTDGDGVDDSEEIKSGTDPRVPATPSPAISIPVQSTTPTSTDIINLEADTSSVIAPLLVTMPNVDGALEEEERLIKPNAISNHVVYSSNTWNQTNDVTAIWRIGWNSMGLYLGVEVEDDVIVQTQTGNLIYLGDSLELQFDTDIQEDIGFGVTEDDYQIEISPGNFSSLRPDVYLARGTQTGTYRDYPDHSIEIAASQTENGYVVEVLIPWEDLDLMPQTGLNIGANFNVNDNDTPGVALQEFMKSNVSTRTYRDPQTWGQLILGE